MTDSLSDLERALAQIEQQITTLEAFMTTLQDKLDCERGGSTPPDAPSLLDILDTEP